jgi:hypothetical protein
MDRYSTSNPQASADWNRRLNNAKEAGEMGEEGDVHFLEVNISPLVSLFITTGKKRTTRRDMLIYGL